MKNSLSRTVIFFTLYSVFGWCYEVFLEVVIYHWGFTNRGVLFGPYCPVYGFGALAFILLVYPMIKDKTAKEKLLRIPLVFIACMLIATAIELGTSYILEAVNGSWPWQTYADYKYNFQARIALSPSIRFGIGGCLFLYVLQPVFELFCNKIGEKGIKVLSVVFILILAADCMYTFVLK